MTILFDYILITIPFLYF